ncbi:MAG: DALR anticodon-binding domain-containing protein, partial [Patescibacteria group bacterium]
VKNPVYYVQYAYVRALNIIKKSKSISGTPDLTRLTSAEDINLIRKLVQFEEVMQETAKDYEVQRLTRYASELAHSFHNFYEKERVVGEEKETAKARLALVKGTETTFLKLFKILGISAPKKM